MASNRFRECWSKTELKAVSNSAARQDERQLYGHFQRNQAAKRVGTHSWALPGNTRYSHSPPLLDTVCSTAFVVWAFSTSSQNWVSSGIFLQPHCFKNKSLDLFKHWYTTHYHYASRTINSCDQFLLSAWKRDRKVLNISQWRVKW